METRYHELLTSEYSEKGVLDGCLRRLHDTPLPITGLFDAIS
jgi:hypothetical protein